MIVIEGYQGKSRRLEELLIEKKTSQGNAILLDTVGVYSLADYAECYLVKSIFEVSQFLYDYTQMDEPFGVTINRDKLKYFVLEVNTSPEMIDTFKKMETLTGIEIIVTIQTDDKEIKVYEI